MSTIKSNTDNSEMLKMWGLEYYQQALNIKNIKNTKNSDDYIVYIIIAANYYCPDAQKIFLENRLPQPNDTNKIVTACELMNSDMAYANSYSLTYLGTLYYTGTKVPKDINKAIDFYEKAIKKGNIVAMNEMGCIILSGQTKCGDYATATNLFNCAYQSGNLNAPHNLAYMYKNGLGCEKDCSKAIELYEISAKNGNHQSMNNLSIMYRRGEGCDKNPKRAFELCKQSVLKGNHNALNNLANMYEHGDGCETDYQLAIELYVKGTMKGNSRALKNLIILYNSRKSPTFDYVKLTNLMEKIATSNSAGSRLGLAQLMVLYKAFNNLLDKDIVIDNLVKLGKLGELKNIYGDDSESMSICENIRLKQENEIVWEKLMEMIKG